MFRIMPWITYQKSPRIPLVATLKFRMAAKWPPFLTFITSEASDVIKCKTDCRNISFLTWGMLRDHLFFVWMTILHDIGVMETFWYIIFFTWNYWNVWLFISRMITDQTRKCTLWRCKSTPTPKAKLLWMTSHYGPTVVRSVTEIPFHVFIW